MPRVRTSRRRRRRVLIKREKLKEPAGHRAVNWSPTLSLFCLVLCLSPPRVSSFFCLPLFAHELFTTRSRAQAREVLGSIPGSAGGSSYHDGHLATGTLVSLYHITLHCIQVAYLQPAMRSHPDFSDLRRTVPSRRFCIASGRLEPLGPPTTDGHCR